MSFTKIHLMLERKNFIAAGHAEIIEEPCNYDRFYKLMERVGKPSNWNKRQVFHDQKSVNRLKSTFEQPSSHLWIFKDGDKEVGFCQVANVTDLKGIFNNATGIAEIYKVGLFPEYIGQGKGKNYLSALVEELFKNNHTIYLNTRDSNVVDSIHFYTKLGFEVFHTETLPDDLVM